MCVASSASCVIVMFPPAVEVGRGGEAGEPRPFGLDGDVAACGLGEADAAGVAQEPGARR